MMTNRSTARPVYAGMRSPEGLASSESHQKGELRHTRKTTPAQARKPCGWNLSTLGDSAYAKPIAVIVIRNGVRNEKIRNACVDPRL
jgi:hypothetical protein